MKIRVIQTIDYFTVESKQRFGWKELKVLKTKPEAINYANKMIDKYKHDKEIKKSRKVIYRSKG